MLLNYFNRVKELYSRYERIILPASFLAGMLWDNFTLRRIDLLYENIVFIWSLVESFLIILLINAGFSGRFRGRVIEKAIPFLPIILQFAFGNLFSGFLIFYFRSGSFYVSWPFLIILAVLILGNDFFRKKYLLLTWQIAIYFIALLSYSVFVLPILLNKMGTFVFLLSGFFALIFAGIVLLLLFFTIPQRFKQNFKVLIFSIAAIYAAFNLLYFANLIPPIPLSLKNSGAYHSIERINEENYIYKVSLEPAPPYLFFKDQSDNFSRALGEQVYFYSAVFSPTDLNVKILHKWSYFDKENRKWVQTDLIVLPTIIGGRDGGYRGYSYKQNVFSGKWRVDVITERGQVIGRRTFTIVGVKEPPELETALR